MASHVVKRAPTEHTVELADGSLLFALADERTALGTRRARQAAEAIEAALQHRLARWLDLPAPPDVVFEEAWLRTELVDRLGWERAAKVRRNVAAPELPLLICRGRDTHMAGDVNHGVDGCGVVFRGQWRRKQLDRAGVDPDRWYEVAAIGPRCTDCHRRHNRAAATRDARVRARAAGVFPYAAYNDRGAPLGGRLWIGTCPDCGGEWSSARAWTRCASCAQQRRHR